METTICAARSAGVLDVPPPPPPRPVEWRRAFTALRQLLAHPEQTEKAFEIFRALMGDEEERNFQRFLARPEGRRLLAERPSLLAVLADREALAAMPPDSFGRAYLAYLERTGFEPDGLLQLKARMEAQARAAGEAPPPLDSVREWYRDRGILTHDLWHVLTDYGTDELGEASLLPFSHAQFGGRANALLVLGTALRGMQELGLSFARYLFQAWRRGRRAAWLPVLPYEELLPLPLEAVRYIAGIVPAAEAHPKGVLRGSLAGPSAAPGYKPSMDPTIASRTRAETKRSRRAAAFCSHPQR
jgi:ubiquinone biosynthesis protein COQ4